MMNSDNAITLILWVMGIGTPAIIGYAGLLTLKLSALRYNVNNLREKMDQHHTELIESIHRDNVELIHYLRYFCEVVSGKEPPPPLDPK